MNNALKNKQCPRCRFPLAKTHSEKMICKRCGYTSNKLQIVTEEDAFDANFKFTKKIHVKKAKTNQFQQSIQQNNLSKYLKYFQQILKYLSTHFFTQLNHQNTIKDRQIMSQNLKYLWFSYLQKMAKQGNVISGMIKGILKRQTNREKRNKKLNASLAKDQNLTHKSEQSDENSSDSQEAQQNNQLQEKKQNSIRSRSINQEQDQKKSSKIKKQVKVQDSQKDQFLKNFKKIVNFTFKKMKSDIQSNQKELLAKSKPSRQFLQKIVDLVNDKNIENVSFNSLIYLAGKYSLILAVQKQYLVIISSLRKRRNRKQKNTSNKLSFDNLLNNNYIKQGDLKDFCIQRGLQFEKRRLYTQFSILSYDLLSFWYQKTKLSEQFNYFSSGQNDFYPYNYLLQCYRNTSQQKWLAIEIINQNLQKMSQQIIIKMQNNQKNVPQLSFKFICALFFTVSVLNNKCISLLQIINYLYKQLEQYFQNHNQNIESEKQWKEKKLIIVNLLKQKNIRVRRVKKLSHQVCKYLETEIKPINKGRAQQMNTKNWTIKIAKLFNIPPKNINQYIILTQTLLSGYLQSQQTGNIYCLTSINGMRLVNNFSCRFMNLQQQQIALASFVIYLKLVFGMSKDKYPFLINIREELLQFKKTMNFEYLQQEDRNRLKQLQIIIQENSGTFGIIRQEQKLKQPQFGLGTLLTFITEVTHSLNANIEHLKCLSGFRSIRQLSKKIKLFNSLLQIQQKKQLNLLHSVTNQSTNNTTTQLSNSFMSNQLTQNIQINYIEKQNQQNKIVKQKKTQSKNIFFENKKYVKRIEFNQNLRKQIDYLIQNISRKKIKKDNLDKKSQVKNRIPQKDKMENNSNMTLQQNQILCKEKLVQDYLDNPSKHYELIYQPTINSLQQLKMHQLLIFIQKLSFYYNGQYTDCKDILEWIGYLENVIIQFQD